MQKKVADYMKALLDRKDLLRLVNVISYVDLAGVMFTFHTLFVSMPRLQSPPSLSLVSFMTLER